MVNDPNNLMRLHLEALYTYDKRERIAGCNQFDGGTAPRFHLARSRNRNFWAIRNDVPRDVAKALIKCVNDEPRLEDPLAPPKHENQYFEILANTRPIEAIWRGPAYRFTQTRTAMGIDIVDIDAHNQHLLIPLMADWLPDVPHRQPLIAAIEAGSAVAVCASARITKSAHEAGVETSVTHRHRGYAKRVVATWANRVSRLGAAPIYSTCLLYTSPSPRDRTRSRMPSSA